MDADDTGPGGTETDSPEDNDADDAPSAPAIGGFGFFGPQLYGGQSLIHENTKRAHTVLFDNGRTERHVPKKKVT